MSFWSRYWHGPIAAIRPYLLVKGALILLAIDLWTDRLARGAHYGVGGFNVAHFQWLDAIQPMPSPGGYVGLMLLCGLLAMGILFGASGRLVPACLFLAYTYSWSMSRLDGFQHHYFLSLVLFCLIFFPKINHHQLFNADKAKMGIKNHTDPSRAGPMTSAWSYALLAAIIAIVYGYTAITKCDLQWLSGQTFKSIGGTDTVFQPAISVLAHIGLPESAFWILISIGIVILESIVMLGYLAAARCADSTQRWRRMGCMGMWLVSMALHLGIELVGLQIGFFSYYMVLLATVFFFPAKWLIAIGWLCAQPYRHFESYSQQLMAARLKGIVGWCLQAILAIALVGFTYLVASVANLPGAISACFSFLLIMVSSILLARAGRQLTARMAATAFAIGALWIALEASYVRFDFYSAFADNLKQMGHLNSATENFEKANLYVKNDHERRAHLLSALGILQQSKGRHTEAMEYYRKSLTADPNYAAGHFFLGAALTATGESERALEYFAASARLAPTWPKPFNGMAWIMATDFDPSVHQPQQAIKHARHAFELGGHASHLDTLAVAYAAAGQFDEAIKTAHKALELAKVEQAVDLIEEIKDRIALFHQGIPYEAKLDATNKPEHLKQYTPANP